MIYWVLYSNALRFGCYKGMICCSEESWQGGNGHSALDKLWLAMREWPGLIQCYMFHVVLQ